METKRRSGLILIIAPLVCAIVAAAAFFYQYRRAEALRVDVAKTDNQIALIGSKLTGVDVQPRSTRVAAATMTTDEQAAFVNWLRMTASFARVQVTKLTNTAQPAPAPGSAEEKTAKSKNPLPANISAVTSAVEVSGRYNDVRDFLYSLLRAQRLLTMTGIQWTRGDKWPVTKVSFTLTRYVTSIAAPAG